MDDRLGDEGAIGGIPITAASGTSKVRAAAGRVCVEPGCGTRLSVYNDEDRCSLHHRPVSLPLRGMPRLAERAAPAAERRSA